MAGRQECDLPFICLCGARDRCEVVNVVNAGRQQQQQTALEPRPAGLCTVSAARLAGANAGAVRD